VVAPSQPGNEPVDPPLELLAARFRECVEDAYWRHRRLGESIVIWRDGQIVTLTGDEIPVDEETERRNVAQRRGELPPPTLLP
jgi:hypothetical protein